MEIEKRALVFFASGCNRMLCLRRMRNREIAVCYVVTENVCDWRSYWVIERLCGRALLDRVVLKNDC